MEVLKYANALLIVFFLHFTRGQDEGTTAEVCGGELTPIAATLLISPDYPTAANPQSKYPSNSDCTWFYDGDRDTLVIVKFWNLFIESGENNSNSTCEYDSVTIKMTSKGEEGTKYCGFVAPPDTIIGFGSLTIIFKSDASVNYQGFRLTYKISPDHNPCEPDPCVNGECGRTEDRVSAKCNCDPGSSGEWCEIDIKECESDPCQNGAACDDSSAPNEYKCQCPIRYEGVNCEIERDSPCSSNPCQNGGTCLFIEDFFEFECECAEFYKGSLCEIADLPPCQSTPCLNGASCDDLPNSDRATNDEGFISDFYGYECTCTADWRGEICQTERGCSDPGIPNLENGRRFEEGATLKFSCADGFILEGPVNLTCHVDGSWSHDMPECVANVTYSTEEPEGSISSWLGTMIGLGVTLAVTVVAFTLWMVYKGPWVKLENEELTGRAMSQMSTVSDSVFLEDAKSAEFY